MRESSMTPLDEPRGLPLAQQALAYARAVRLAEFGAREVQSRPAVFPMMDVLHAINRGEAARRVAATVALQEFMSAPQQLQRRFRGRVAELVTAGDAPAGATMQAYIDRFLITPGEMDLGYEAIFATHDVATAEMQLLRSGFKVLNVTSGITFKKRVPGEPVQFRAVTAAEALVNYEMWGGGVSIDRVWWDDQDYLTIQDVITAFRQDAYYERAKALYGLLTGLSNAINITTGANLIAKINNAVADILRKTQGRGYNASPMTQFVLMYSPELAGDVDAALNISSDVAVQTSAAKQRLQYRFMKVPTIHVPSSGASAGVYVILPKNQLKCGYRMDLTLYGNFNVASYADDIAGFHRFGAIVADTDQVRRIA